jgi:beta-glucosidase
MTLEEKIDMIGGVDSFYIRENKRLGLPALKMADGPVGIRNYGPSTTMPGGIGFAASWDPALVERAGQALGDDARARGVHFLLGPGVNIYRAPMCGRNFEYFGEDPFLASQTAVSYIRGLQSRGVIATVKHYMGNNSEYDRHNIDSEIDERTMREIYLPVFEAAVKQGKVGAIMDSYNLVNGEHATQNGVLNNQIAKRGWGFQGIVMSDWSATYDGVAAANGGLDLEMPSGKFMNRETLLPAVQSGKVTQATIDDKVRRILREAVLFGFLDGEQADHSISLLNKPADALALQAARESIVLLKNEGNLLPLDKKTIRSIAVIGPDAYPAQPDGGGSAHVVPFHAVSYLEGLSNCLGNAKVLYNRGLRTYPEIAGKTEFTTDDGQPGLRGEYFANSKLEGTPTQTRVDKHINIGGEDYNENGKEISIRWTGNYVAHTSGPHDFFVRGPGGNGGYRLYVDDKLVVDNWERATALLNFAAVPLEAESKHKVRLEYFRNSEWGPSRLSFGVLPQSEAVEADAKTIASQADAAVVFIGFDSTIESEASDRTFSLPPGQDELVREIMAANKKTIVVLTAGGGADMSAWVDQIPALLHGWYSGQEGGAALAQLLFGDYSPSGRLPITLERRIEDNAAFNSYYPNDGPKRVKYNEGVFVGYRHFDHDNIKPLFPFGYGLSYSSFAYKNLNVTPTAARSDQPVTVTFDVTNTGSRPAAEVAQVYVGEAHPSVPRPVRELKGFARVELNPGETRHISVPLDQRAFAYYDVTGKGWKVDPGEFAIYVGKSVEDVQLTGKINLQ